MAFNNPYASHRTRRKSHIVLPVVIVLALITYFNDSLYSSLLLQKPSFKSHGNGEKSTDKSRKNNIKPINDRKSAKSHDGVSIPTNQQKGKIKKVNNHPIINNHNLSTFIPTLRDKKIFFEVVTVGLKQFSYLEEIIDSVRDMCEAGAHVSFHITSSNCNPNPNQDEDECPIRNQSSEETAEDNFNIETIDHLNERVRCRNPEGSLDLSIHLVSPDWG